MHKVRSENHTLDLTAKLASQNIAHCVHANERLSVQQLISFLPSSMWIFWKDLNSIYRGCNAAFSNLIGMQNDFGGLKIADVKYLNSFQVNPMDARILEETDQKIFDCSISLELTRKLSFVNHPVEYIIHSKGFPIVNDSDKISGIFVIGSGQFDVLPGIDNIFRLVNSRKIGMLLRNNKYNIKYGTLQTTLTRREITCFLYTMLGKTAQATAEAMNIKPKTAEDILNILKDKLGCHSKSELIAIGFESNLLDQIQKNLSIDIPISLEKTTESILLFEGNNRLYIKD